MDDCIERGLHTDGILPGGLKVKRRAKGIYDALQGGTWYEPDSPTYD